MIDVPLVLFILHAAMATTMRAAADLFGEFSRAAAPVVVSALWQGAIVAAGLAVTMRLARRASAGHRFAIWAAGFGALICLPFLSTWMVGTGGHLPNENGVAAGPLLRLDPRWTFVIGAVWIMASAFRAAGLGVHTIRLRRLWKTAKPIENDGILPSLVPKSRPGAPNVLSNILRRNAEVCTTSELDRPAVIGFLAPRILIPEWLYERLTPKELEHLILHESEHLRRGDDWINLVQKLCLVLFPLNPALMWMDRRLATEREMACDEGVVRATKAPRAYAACLASLAERGLKHRAELLSLGAWQCRPELVERVHRILKHKQGLSPIATRAMVGALSCGLVVASVEFAHAPQLVAFAPAPQALAQERTAAAIGDARYVDTGYGAGYGDDAKGAAAFRAVDAVAEMPAGGARADNRVNRVSVVKQSNETQAAATRNTLLNTPRVELLKTEMSNAHAAEREEQAQTMWIVLTASEEGTDHHWGHRGDRRDAGMSQDYDSPAAEGGAARDGVAITNAAVTQLIFRIYEPTASAAASQGEEPSDWVKSGYANSGNANSDSATSSSANSHSSADQPAAISLRDGWFIFQL